MCSSTQTSSLGFARSAALRDSRPSDIMTGEDAWGKLFIYFQVGAISRFLELCGFTCLYPVVKSLDEFMSAIANYNYILPFIRLRAGYVS